MLLGLILLAGCRLPSSRPGGHGAQASGHLPAAETLSDKAPSVQQASWHEMAQSADAGAVLQAGGELSLDELVGEVLAVNPSIESAAAAWRAAAARYPSQVALDDPMFGFMLGPDSFDSNEVEGAYMLEGSQKLPWPGKRQLRGRVARAEANAAFHDIGEARLRIAEAARLAFYDYYLADRNFDLNARNTELMREFRQDAEARYEAGTAEQQDLLLADVELADLARRQAELLRMRRVAVARINTLLRRPPSALLPPPPAGLPSPLLPASSVELIDMALSQRPDLAAQAARIRARRAATALACKEFYPDFTLVARYDAFWQEEELRPMVGANLNLPLNKDKRRAAVREAAALLRREQAELESRIDQIRYDVQSTYELVLESQRVTELYRDEILPAAELSKDSARAGYVSGQLDFLRLIEAQRQIIDIHQRSYQAQAELHQRLAELERAVGGPLPRPADPNDQLPLPPP